MNLTFEAGRSWLSVSSARQFSNTVSTWNTWEKGLGKEILNNDNMIARKTVAATHSVYLAGSSSFQCRCPSKESYIMVLLIAKDGHSELVMHVMLALKRDPLRTYQRSLTSGN